MVNVTLLIDTFCATNCKYCELPNRAKNVATYGYERLDNLMALEQPEMITVYAGDTFYNHDNIRKAYAYACSVPSVTRIQSISEIQKLEKDFDIRLEMINLCRKHNKTAGVEFSLDLAGTKSGNHVEVINRFAKAANLGMLNFSCVLTIEQIMSDNIVDTIHEYIETYKSLDIIGMLRVVLDYNAATTKDYSYAEIAERAEGVHNAFYDSLVHPVNKGMLPSVVSKASCRIKSEGTLVKYDGMLSTCGKVRPEFDITPVSALDITPEDYAKFVKSKTEFKSVAIHEACATCEAKPICNACPKFIHSNKSFDGNSDTCMFYRALHNISKMYL